MKLADLHPAIHRIRTVPVTDLRARTYLLTYPRILHLASAKGGRSARLELLALMAYGWMPRIVRLEPEYLETAMQAIDKVARAASKTNISSLPIEPLVRCLRSVVGASKVLHFLNPSLFPIWDSKVESFRQKGGKVAGRQMNLANYLAYAKDVEAIRLERGFGRFYRDIGRALAARLHALNITPYHITEVRAIECAAFELAGGEPEE